MTATISAKSAIDTNFRTLFTRDKKSFLVHVTAILLLMVILLICSYYLITGKHNFPPEEVDDIGLLDINGVNQQYKGLYYSLLASVLCMIVATKSSITRSLFNGIILFIVFVIITRIWPFYYDHGYHIYNMLTTTPTKGTTDNSSTLNTPGSRSIIPMYEYISTKNSEVKIFKISRCLYVYSPIKADAQRKALEQNPIPTKPNTFNDMYYRDMEYYNPELAEAIKKYVNSVSITPKNIEDEINKLGFINKIWLFWNSYCFELISVFISTISLFVNVLAAHKNHWGLDFSVRTIYLIITSITFVFAAIYLILGITRKTVIIQNLKTNKDNNEV